MVPPSEAYSRLNSAINWSQAGLFLRSLGFWPRGLGLEEEKCEESEAKKQELVKELKQFQAELQVEARQLTAAAASSVSAAAAGVQAVRKRLQALPSEEFEFLQIASRLEAALACEGGRRLDAVLDVGELLRRAARVPNVGAKFFAAGDARFGLPDNVAVSALTGVLLWCGEDLPGVRGSVSTAGSEDLLELKKLVNFNAAECVRFAVPIPESLNGGEAPKNAAGDVAFSELARAKASLFGGNGDPVAVVDRVMNKLTESGRSFQVLFLYWPVLEHLLKRLNHLVELGLLTTIERMDYVNRIAITNLFKIFDVLVDQCAALDAEEVDEALGTTNLITDVNKMLEKLAGPYACAYQPFFSERECPIQHLLTDLDQEELERTRMVVKLKRALHFQEVVKKQDIEDVEQLMEDNKRLRKKLAQRDRQLAELDRQLAQLETASVGKALEGVGLDGDQENSPAASVQFKAPQGPTQRGGGGGGNHPGSGGGFRSLEPNV